MRPDHVHSQRSPRCCADEPTEQVVAKLAAIEPVWEDHKHDAAFHAVTGESKAEFLKRRALWEQVHKRETGRG